MTILNVKLGVFVKAWTLVAFLGIYEILNNATRAVAAREAVAPTILPWVTAGVPLIGIVLTWFLTRTKLQEIHVLVNSRLSKALEEIAELRTQISDRDPGNVRKASEASLAQQDAKPNSVVPDVKT